MYYIPHIPGSAATGVLDGQAQNRRSQGRLRKRKKSYAKLDFIHFSGVAVYETQT
jgi:hypothetical protein